MALVDHQQIPGGVSCGATAVGFGVGAGPGSLKELLQHVRHPQVMPGELGGCPADWHRRWAGSSSRAAGPWLRLPTAAVRLPGNGSRRGTRRRQCEAVPEPCGCRTVPPPGRSPIHCGPAQPVQLRGAVSVASFRHHVHVVDPGIGQGLRSSQPQPFRGCRRDPHWLAPSSSGLGPRQPPPHRSRAACRIPSRGQTCRGKWLV